MDRLVLGVDVAQRRDWTALALVHEVYPEPPPEWNFPALPGDLDATDLRRVARREPPAYHVRFLERFRERPYPDVAARVAEAATNAKRLAPRSRLVVAVDATGVGRPVVDLVVRALRGVPCKVSAVTFGPGDGITGQLGDPEIRIGKPWFASRIAAVLESGRLRVGAGLPLADVLAAELEDYQIKVRKEDGHATFGAGGDRHDDLTTAVGLGVIGRYRRTGFKSYL